jgi:hypothetical protein
MKTASKKYREEALQSERRTKTPTMPVKCKCPVCLTLHTVSLALGDIEKGKTPRLYCKQHRWRRFESFEAYAYGRTV